MAEKKQAREALRARVRAAKLRATAARIAVLQCLAGARAPLSHAEVFERLGDVDFDKATVYRNLMDLSEAGILRRADVGDHVWRFELLRDEDDPDERHPHFICSDCGTIECLPADAIQVSTGAVKGKAVEVHVRGVCDDCA